MSATSFLKFLVGDRKFGIRISEIQEIATIREFQKVLKAPPEIKGVADIKGRVMTLVEPAPVFKTSCEPTAPFYAVILASPFQHLALSVYSEFDIQDGEPIFMSDEKEETGNGEQTPGKLARLGSETVTLLDPEEIVRYCERKVLESFKVRRMERGSGDEEKSPDRR